MTMANQILISDLLG